SVSCPVHRFDPASMRFAVSVRVQDIRTPALRLRWVVRFLELFRIHPTEHVFAAAGPQSTIRVVGEFQVMSSETGIDKSELSSYRIINFKFPAVACAAGLVFLDGKEF